MRNIFSRVFGVCVAILFFVSCTKTHYTSPTPPNYRLHSVEVITQVNGGRYENGNYAFTYDTLNRLIKYTYTSNDTSFMNFDAYFSYWPQIGKIYKTYYKLNDSTPLQTDSFLINSAGQIIQMWTYYAKCTLQYNGKLLYEIVDSNNHSMIYTAHEGDFYKSTSDISYDSTETFLFLKTMNNRMGDYLQLKSFLLYGQNLYQNTHLVEEIDNSGSNTSISYIIDAYSKITQTNVVMVDSIGNNYKYTYNIAYETF